MIVLNESYETMLKRSYGYSEVIQRHSPAWQLMKKLYDKNYIHAPSTIQRIPKRIHQIWLGGNLPDQYKAYTETWLGYHPDWDYTLWTDKDIKAISLHQPKLFQSCINMGMKSDILRYELLYQLGGLYVDTDFECLKPFDDLMNLNFFTSISYDRELVLYIGLIASVPGHPIMSNCLKTMVADPNLTKGSRIMDATGAYHFTRSFLRATNEESQGVVAFPMDFFYPFPNNVRGIEEPYQYVKPFSYALHHWAVSWVKHKRR